MGPALVPSHARCHLLNRVRFVVGASGRAYWQRWNLADKSISTGGSRTTRRPRLLAVADTLLVQFEQCISSFSLRRRCRFVVAPDRRTRSGGFAYRTVRLLPVTYDRWTNFSQLPMGHSAAGNGLFRDLSRTVSNLAKALTGTTGLACRAVFAQAAAFQIDCHFFCDDAATTEIYTLSLHDARPIPRA